MTLLKNIFTTLIGTFLIILLPFVIFTFVTSKSPALFDFRSFVVLTGSMEPVIPVGSMVYTQPKPAYNPGEIITFKDNDERTVTHRIESVTGEGTNATYVTKGDANNVQDKTSVPNNNVVGSVFFNVPYIGNYTDFFKQPINFLGFIVFPALIFIGFELWNIKNEIVKETERKVLKRLEQQQV